MTPSTARPVLTAYGRALRSQFTGPMLRLSILPFLLSLVLWGLLLYFGYEPFRDYVATLFASYNGYGASSTFLGFSGMGVLKAIIVPLLSMLVLLPLMIVTSMIFMGVAGMPPIVRHVSARQYPKLEMKRGGSFMGSVMINLTGYLVFVPLWLLSLPLYAFAPLAVLAQVLLWGWLTSRVMAYDALADHASAQEMATIVRAHRRPLMLIGMVSGAAGALPGLAWVGGAIVSVLLFPILAALSVWLFTMVFIFTGLWYQYYCLQALEELRAQASPAQPLPA
ncbi:EI24 domain-containing protein [Massilia sp. PAMC28688]|uniref:EI24 domain-containing protein n=1 Tax=Massilia sp. PAMC28688 TaxID=2861283 RepID=UPI001C62E21F|nr:EI24 domain-containing protein [Massilia sp. PAMC28688]QYF94259.1 EI24 domain-containing protein [Massilia sp. PAMC28688]